VLAVAAVSQRLSNIPVTPAMVFVAIGVLVGPLVLDEVNAAPKSSMVRTFVGGDSQIRQDLCESADSVGDVAEDQRRPPLPATSSVRAIEHGWSASEVRAATALGINATHDRVFRGATLWRRRNARITRSGRWTGLRA
jgi:hypothetical protein